MLQNQLARGNNGLIKTKYLTFGIDADSIKAAKPRLERIEMCIRDRPKANGSYRYRLSAVRLFLPGGTGRSLDVYKRQGRTR